MEIYWLKKQKNERKTQITKTSVSELRQSFEPLKESDVTSHGSFPKVFIDCRMAAMTFNQ